jgi:hypothetical protein
VIDVKIRTVQHHARFDLTERFQSRHARSYSYTFGMRTVRPAALTKRPSQEALLTESSTRNPSRDSIEMQDAAIPTKTSVETRDNLEISRSVSNGGPSESGATLRDAHEDAVQSHEPLRLYKRRFFGLFQLVLLNIIVSWDVSY